jgi:hypothetical protein
VADDNARRIVLPVSVTIRTPVGQCVKHLLQRPLQATGSPPLVEVDPGDPTHAWQRRMR